MSVRTVYAKGLNLVRAVNYSLHLEVRRPFLNRKSTRLYLEYGTRPTSLSNIQKRILDGLVENGISIMHLSDLIPSISLRKLQDFASSEMDKVRNKIEDSEKGIASPGRQKFYNVEVWDNPIVEMANPLLALAISPELLQVANAYLHQFSRLLYFNIWYNIPMPGSSILSQNWHRDPDDRNCVKMFLYLNDVGEGSGPFCYIPKTQWGNIYGKILPRGPPLAQSPPPEVVEKTFADKERLVCTGKAGTIIFCDTTGFHKGGHATNMPRILFNSIYVTNGSIFRNQRRFKTPAKADQVGDLSQRHALWIDE